LESGVADEKKARLLEALSAKGETAAEIAGFVEAFLQHAGRVLKTGGQLHVWTDVGEYFTESMAAARATGLFHEPREEPTQPAEHDLDYQTHFERRTRLAGAPVWRALLERSTAPATCTRTAVPLPG
jgi:hypothetical protein